MRALCGSASASFEVKKSRFLAYAAPVDGETQALSFIAARSDRGATHNCHAWRVGAMVRVDDDGEPSGTAGRPILAAIDGRGLCNAAVLVVRHFGGIKLGTGGLARAYQHAAALALDGAPMEEVVEEVGCTFRVPFDAVATVHLLLSRFAGHKEAEHWESVAVRFHVRLPAAAGQEFARALSNGTGGRMSDLQLVPVPSRWDVPR